jgi:O-acetyl-ADP-ribose deacetylase (regulator of RNase III)
MLTINKIVQDITKVEHGILCQGVNCQLAMGSGVALAYKIKWPAIYSRYMDGPCGKDALGEAMFIEVEDNVVVANLYTQEYYGRDGKRYASPEAIEESFRKTVAEAIKLDLPIYLPKIGAGLGGLDWEADVVPALNKATDDRDVTVTLCLYGD